MADVKRRSYSSGVRAEQAALTRERILDSAHSLFGSQGYARTTIKQIADGARVAPDTVYAVFGSKPRVLTALIDRALTHGRFSNVLDRPEALRVKEEHDQARQIELFVADIERLQREARPVFSIMSGAAAADPELDGVRREMEASRAKNMRRVAGWLGAQGPLRVPVARAGDILWALLSPDLATLLLDTRGWTEKRLTEWRTDMLKRALLP